MQESGWLGKVVDALIDAGGALFDELLKGRPIAVIIGVIFAIGWINNRKAALNLKDTARQAKSGSAFYKERFTGKMKLLHTALTPLYIIEDFCQFMLKGFFPKVFSTTIVFLIVTQIMWLVGMGITATFHLTNPAGAEKTESSKKGAKEEPDSNAEHGVANSSSPSSVVSKSAK